MGFITAFKNISVISCWSVYWWRKIECPEKTTDLPQVNDKLYQEFCILSKFHNLGPLFISFSKIKILDNFLYWRINDSFQELINFGSNNIADDVRGEVYSIQHYVIKFVIDFNFQKYFGYIVLVSLLVEENWMSGENNRSAASQWQTLSHNVVSSTPRHERRQQYYYFQN
jgi:hypothetical protein